MKSVVLVATASLALVVSCTSEQTQDRHAVARAPLVVQLGPSLEPERGRLEEEIDSACGIVADWFGTAGCTVPRDSLIDSVIVFDDPGTARQRLCEAFGVDTSAIPVTFAGTVASRTLFLVSPSMYQTIWTQLYPNWPWTETAYLSLVVHELAHRAHELTAMTKFGSADAMGPVWFFEGLAIACAAQFLSPADTLSRDSILERVGAGASWSASYPEYGQLVRSLARYADWSALIVAASRTDFPESLLVASAAEKKP